MFDLRQDDSQLAPALSLRWSAAWPAKTHFGGADRNLYSPAAMAALAGMWLLIGMVSAYDTYLTVKYQDLLWLYEMNPIGRWLILADGGSVAMFLGLKVAGTVLVLGALPIIYLVRAAAGLIVAAGVAGFQTWLAWYLTFA